MYIFVSFSDAKMNQMLDYSSKSLLVLLPASLMLSPSFDWLTNIVLAGVMPLHIHLGLAGVLTGEWFLVIFDIT